MLKPLHDRVLVLPDPKETETASGILLMEDKNERPVKGVVVVGNKAVKKGDKVLFSRFALDEVNMDGQDYVVVSAAGILGIFE
ncbi:MAG: co-chaperone GroES [Candidatus Pacebacteria bacterium]|nr:co-chaperone GroES [Candidatus Paceibacterota bacterium]